MKFFSNIKPDMKDSPIKQKDKTNRTQPKNTPSIPIDIPTPSMADINENQGSLTNPEETKTFKRSSNGGFNLSAFNRTFTSASEPADKSMALIELNSNDWIFTQATILSSVNIEEDGFSITPATGKYVNDNGNSWSSQTVEKWYKTFIGAHNYQNHIQERDKSKGIILDAVLRKIPTDDNPNEFIYYVDILVATNKNIDPEWAQAIEKERVKYMSMGCISSALRCSKCGNISFSDNEDCEHQLYELGYYYLDKEGNKRKVSSLITDDKEYDESKGYVVFVEASYLSKDPAYQGACLGHYIKTQPNTIIKFQVPRKALARDAFQYWGIDKGQIKGIVKQDVIEDINVTPALYK